MNFLSENQRALMLFEQNEYDEAFALLKQLADSRRWLTTMTSGYGFYMMCATG